ncbi:alpha/beta hydrolase [Paracoccus sp. MBLB3053]|uniref:Alpha/beta hydrolase n=1 Tax=Paracoccus aurantius TaxID=3073814 RepID=A0ABU2HRK6_9RHOB|nr:alpha/beta hydrolase [Paracoccus sp. MBLB3053]MDS9467667.1 alpha/beta hydrolase [Paracoccus sp. MBLB3053]
MNIRHWPGNPERPALALHCMMGNASYWGPIARELGDLVEITAPDLPGHGKSRDWEGVPPDFHTTATREVAPLIQRPLDLIGHSIGATIALRIAVAAPEAVRSLTLIEPVLFAAAPDPENEAFLHEIRSLVENSESEKATSRFLSVWGGIDWESQSPATRDRLIGQIKMVVSGNDTLIDDSAQILRNGGLESIDAPVLLIMGEDSPPAIPAIAEALSARLADVGRASIPGAGHMLPITHPEQTADLIRLNIERA